MKKVKKCNLEPTLNNNKDFMRILACFLLIIIISYSALSEDDKEYKFDVGFGFGGNYGFTGINLDYLVLPNLNSFIGIGFAPTQIPPYVGNKEEYRIRWAIGAKYHFLSSDNNIRPRVSLMYGINSLWEHNRKSEDGKYLGKFENYGRGLSIGIGFKWMMLFEKKLGFDVDIFYAITKESYIDDDDINKYYPKLSSTSFTGTFGIRYAFNL